MLPIIIRQRQIRGRAVRADHIDLAKWPHISAVNARVGARAKVIAAMTAEGLVQ